jgi:hypothetical protein
MTMMYQSSKGPVDIATMPLRYAGNALAKLKREEPTRTAEIEALEQHCASLAEEGEENPRVVIGNNNPPEETKPMRETPTSWKTAKLRMDELLDEARGITGVEIVTQLMADQAGKLLRDLQAAADDADGVRVSEKAPLDEKINEIQDRYNEYIAPMKNKKPGLVRKAETALKNQIAAWLNKLEAEKVARETAAREAAEKAAAEALAAHTAAKQSDDLDEIDAAEDLMAAADSAARDLRQIETQKVQARGDYRAIGLRSVWHAHRIEGEGGKALSHYAKTQPARVISFIQALADEDVKAGIRNIPGFNVIEERVV